MMLLYNEDELFVLCLWQRRFGFASFAKISFSFIFLKCSHEFYSSMFGSGVAFLFLFEASSKQRKKISHIRRKFLLNSFSCRLWKIVAVFDFIFNHFHDVFVV